MLLGELCNELAKNITSFPSLTLQQLLLFFTLATKLKHEILLVQLSTYSPQTAPLFLPSAIIGFLTEACGFDANTVTQWMLLKEVIWQEDHSTFTGVSNADIEAIFHQHGHDYGLGKSTLAGGPSAWFCLVSQHTLWPPRHTCVIQGCSQASSFNDVKLIRSFSIPWTRVLYLPTLHTWNAMAVVSTTITITMFTISNDITMGHTQHIPDWQASVCWDTPTTNMVI